MEVWTIVAVYAATVIVVGIITMMLADAFSANELVFRSGLIVTCAGFLALMVALIGTVMVQVTS